MKRLIGAISIIGIIFLLVGCGGIAKTVGISQPAQMYQPKSEVHEALTTLPQAKNLVIAGVYQFQDQSGQYKPASGQVSNASFSRALTQGANSVLVEALRNSGWFTIVEREGLENLVKERTVIRSNRMEFKDETPMTPMLYAGVIFEGGVISYDTDVMTSGFGVKWFGSGGSAQVRKDQITVYLRAISVGSGKVLASVSTTKTIYSKMVDLGIYKYIKPNRLLEAEIGFSTNEPTQYCVRDAIEKAVTGIIIEGIIDGLWELKNPEDIKCSIVEQYIKETNGK